MRYAWVPFIALVTLATPALAHKSYPPVTPDISCPGDRVVWVNTNSGVYHYEGERWFGRTKSGQFECEKQAKAEGDHATENGQ
ncbi:hypothetical protein [Acidisoma silvae]|uniref:DUF3761 domain-containing protein n=1 Tax=Acidisoma silvae TaxID=2802396 RepID=A0A964E1Z4_9PROT|nr:hypothetical protein [Acidisoma silvae]MCB8878283.1 hypothetical protein [Acidisoma silvae]